MGSTGRAPFLQVNKLGDVTGAIRKYVNEELRLSQSDINQTLRSREWLLKRIGSVINARNREPTLYSTQKFVYFGSYFKGTKVKAVDEYDVLVVIDSNGGIYSHGGTKIGDGQGNATPNHKYDNKYFKSDGSGISPAKMLNWLKGVVEEVTGSFGGEAPIRNGQAVTATIRSNNVKVDLVPAGIFNRTYDGATFYNIPRGDSGNGWIVTSPRADIDLLNLVAKDKSDFRNVIRIAKRVKETYDFKVSSFAIETAIVNHGLLKEWHNNLFLDVAQALLTLSSNFMSGSVSDPYDRSNNLIDGTSSLSWYASRLSTIVDRLLKCTKMNDQTAINTWVYRAFENLL